MEAQQLKPLMRLVYTKTDATYIVLSTTMQVRIGLPTPPEVQAWFDAHTELKRTYDVYNAALAEAQARWQRWPNQFGHGSPNEQFDAYTKAGNRCHAMVPPMFDALLAVQQQPHASWVPGVLYANELTSELYSRPLDAFSGFEIAQNQTIAVKFLPLVVQLGGITADNRSQEDLGHDDGY